MSDLSRAKSVRQPDADGTRAEDDRQLTELLLQNRVSLKSTAVEPGDTHGSQPWLSHLKTGIILFLALPLSLLAYFSTPRAEDDFYA